MALGEAILVTAFGVPAYDWLMVTGSAARATSFDYEYWPLSTLRWVSVALLLVGVFVTFLLMTPPDDRLWIMAPAFTAILIHGWIAIADIFKQRRFALQNTDES